MFRFSTFRYALPTSMRVKQYIDHLYPKDGKELLPMQDIMPSAHDGMHTAIEFQKMFLETICNNSHTTTTSSTSTATTQPVTVGGWVCTLPGDGLLRNMGHHETIYSPIPSDLVAVASSSSSSSDNNINNRNNNNNNNNRLSFSKKRKRIQSLEMVLAVRLDENTISTPNPIIEKVAPAILLRGSRYPFYAPHVPGFASDLSSAVHLIIGGNSNSGSSSSVVGIDYASLPFNLEGMGTVLTLGVEPICVGYIQKFHLHDAVSGAAQYIQMNFDRQQEEKSSSLKKPPTTTSTSLQQKENVNPAENNEATTVSGMSSGGGEFLRDKCGIKTAGGGMRGKWWFATGCLSRVPAAVGNYRANFGLLGDVNITITE